MRLRKKPWARPELESCDFFIQNPKEYKDKWNSSFLREQPIHLELGCGKGGFIAKKAHKNLDINFLAIDIKDEVLVLAKRNIEKEFNEDPIKNVKIMAQEIRIINEVIDENDKIERIYINFCNPWPKDRHKKRRLTHTRQLENYKRFLVSGAEIWFKTDDDDLFEESIPYFEESNLEITYITRDLHNSDFKENIETEHEKMFTKQGIKTKFLIAKYKG